MTIFLHHSGAGLEVLNGQDTSSPWGPTTNSPRTTLFSWLQAINMSCPVVPNRVLTPSDLRGRPARVKQFRWPGDPPRARGDWYTWEESPSGMMGLPAGQSDERYFEVVRPVTCLETTIADAFTG